MDVTRLLTQVKNNEISIEKAEAELKNLPYEDLGFAKLDHHRKVRQSFEEVVYCQGKTTEHLVKNYQTLFGEGIDVLGTRAVEDQYKAVKTVLPNAQWDSVSRILKVEKKKKGTKGLYCSMHWWNGRCTGSGGISSGSRVFWDKSYSSIRCRSSRNTSTSVEYVNF